jgi:hypothetical protein
LALQFYWTGFVSNVEAKISQKQILQRGHYPHIISATDSKQVGRSQAQGALTKGYIKKKRPQQSLLVCTVQSEKSVFGGVL